MLNTNEKKSSNSITKEAMKYFIYFMPLISKLGLVKKIDPEKNSYNKFKSCREACSYFNLKSSSNEVILADWRSVLISDIIRTFAKGFLAFVSELENNNFPKSYLNDLITTGSAKKVFAQESVFKNFFKILSKVIYDMNSYEYRNYSHYTIENLLQELEIIIDKLANLQSTSSNKENELWCSFRLKIETLKSIILKLQNDFKNLSTKDKKNFEELFQWTFKYNPHATHWCALLYCSLLKSQNLADSFAIKESHWVNIILKDIADAGFMSTILESRKNRKCIILYIGSNHCKRIAGYLEQLGYQKIEHFDDLNNGKPLSENQLSSLVNKFLGDN